MSERSDLPAKILIVDDDPSDSKAMSDFLQRHSVTVHTAHDLQTALYQFNQNKYDTVIVELDFTELPGLALIQRWRNHESLHKQLTGFVLTCGSKRSAGNEGLAKELGDIPVVNKPCSDIKLLPVLNKSVGNTRKAIAAYELEKQVITPLILQKRFDTAIEQIKSKLNDLGHRGLQLLRQTYELAGRQQEALELTEQLCEKSPGNIALINMRARLLLQMGRPQEAMRFMEQADQLAPGNIERIENMAKTYLRLKMPDQSVAKYKELISKFPDDPALKFGIYEQLYAHGFDEHATQLGKDTATPMEIVRHYNNKGVALSKSGNIDEALKNYKNALKFYPTFKENYRILFNIALAEITKKSPKANATAQAYLEKCLKFKPDFEKAQRLLTSIKKRKIS